MARAMKELVISLTLNRRAAGFPSRAAWICRGSVRRREYKRGLEEREVISPA